MKIPHSPQRRLPIILSLIAVAAIAGLCLGVYLWLYTPLPTLDGFAAYLLPSSRYTPVPLEAISPAARQAVVAIEEPDFYTSYPSFPKPTAIARGVWNSWRCTQRPGRCLVDGFSIPQGVARQWMIATRNYSPLSFRREMREMVLTMRMMRRYTAGEVLTLYLNQTPYGSGVYGSEAAAQHYFNKSAADLTPGEAAALQSLAHFPTSDLAQIKKGQAIILSRMAEQGYITTEQAQEARDAPLQFAAR